MDRRAVADAAKKALSEVKAANPELAHVELKHDLTTDAIKAAEKQSAAPATLPFLTIPMLAASRFVGRFMSAARQQDFFPRPLFRLPSLPFARPPPLPFPGPPPLPFAGPPPRPFTSRAAHPPSRAPRGRGGAKRERSGDSG